MPETSEPSSAGRGTVLVVGGVGVDTLVSVPVLPVPMADTVHVPRMRQVVGHTGSGWALALHGLGVPVHLVDLIGDDLEGALVRSVFAQVGLPFSYAVTPAGTKRSVNLVDPSGRRQSFYDGRDQSLGGVDEGFGEGFYEGPLASARHVHISINDWTRPVLRRAVAAGLSVSTDLHDWDGVNGYHEEFALSADVVTMSEIDSGAASRAVAERILASGRARVVVTTAGDRGATVHVPGAGPVHVPAHTPSKPVVDSNGAGDAFGAGFLAAWLDGADPVEAARFGAVVGALACTAYGVGRLTTRAEVAAEAARAHS